MILAAGKGTRMKTDKPKVAVLLNGKPLISHVIENLHKAGIENIIVVVGYKKDEVISLCDQYDNIRFTEQTEQLGTAHALQCASDMLQEFNGPVIVTAGDAPLISSTTFDKIHHFHSEQGVECTVLSADMDNPFGYGRIIRNEDGFVTAIVEEKDATDEQRKIREINTGTYCFNSPSVFGFIKQIGNNNAQKEYYLPDLIHIFKSEKLPVGAIKLENWMESHGVNSMEDLEKVSSLIKEGHLHDV